MTEHPLIAIDCAAWFRRLQQDVVLEPAEVRSLIFEDASAAHTSDAVNALPHLRRIYAAARAKADSEYELLEDDSLSSEELDRIGRNHRAVELMQERLNDTAPMVDDLHRATELVHRGVHGADLLAISDLNPRAAFLLLEQRYRDRLSKIAAAARHTMTSMELISGDHEAVLKYLIEHRRLYMIYSVWDDSVGVQKIWKSALLSSGLPLPYSRKASDFMDHESMTYLFTSLRLETDYIHQEKERKMELKDCERKLRDGRRCWHCKSDSHLVWHCPADDILHHMPLYRPRAARVRQRQKKGLFSDRSTDQEKTEQCSFASVVIEEDVEEEQLSPLPIVPEMHYDNWLVSSSAEQHYTFRRDWLQSYESIVPVDLSSNFDKMSLQAIGRGNVHIQDVHGKLILKNVLHVPALTCNLFAFRKMPQAIFGANGNGYNLSVNGRQVSCCSSPRGLPFLAATTRSVTLPEHAGFSPVCRPGIVSDDIHYMLGLTICAQ